MKKNNILFFILVLLSMSYTHAMLRRAMRAIKKVSFVRNATRRYTTDIITRSELDGLKTKHEKLRKEVKVLTEKVSQFQKQCNRCTKKDSVGSKDNSKKNAELMVLPFVTKEIIPAPPLFLFNTIFSKNNQTKQDAQQKEKSKKEKPKELSKTDKMRLELKQIPLDESYKKQIGNDIDKFERLNDFNSDKSKIEEYLHSLFAMPWGKKSKQQHDIKQVAEILRAELYGMREAKEEIVDMHVAKVLDPSIATQKILLVGSPGVGKTALAMTAAKALGKKYGRIAVGGARDDAILRGHGRTYVGSQDGWITRSLRTLEVDDPVIVIDELDKAGREVDGVLTEILDPEQNTHFMDNYLAVPYDLSQVLFIATANELDDISSHLRDRFHVIKVPGYTFDEKVKIAQNHLIRRAHKKSGLANHGIEIPISDEVVAAVIDRYTNHELGVRELERKLTKLLFAAARIYVKNEEHELPTFTTKNFENFLGKPKGGDLKAYII